MSEETVTQIATAHSNANQKVRICQRKCDSRNVPTVAERRA